MLSIFGQNCPITEEIHHLITDTTLCNGQGRRNGLFIGASGKFFHRGDWPTADFADFFKGGSQIIGASQDARKPGSAGPDQVYKVRLELTLMV